MNQNGIPSFSLYNIGSDCSKSCFESQNLTILCSISPPYFERSKTNLHPNLNCTLNGAKLSEAEIRGISDKVKQIFNTQIVQEKYLRMNFDLEYQIVELKNQQQLFPALINLLCFTLILSGVQIKSIFSCAQAWLVDEKIQWNKNQEISGKKMCLALQSSQKQIVFFALDGEYVFVHVQRLANILMDANEQIHNYMIKKIGQINDSLQN